MSESKCGKTAGYQAHIDNGTATCRPCRDAQADWQRHYRTRMYLAGGPLLIDPTGTRRRLHALVRMGWTFEHLAARLGVTGAAVRGWTYNTLVRRDTAARVAAVYDELWGQRGPSVKTAERAKTKGWLPPLAWDDETIDDPAARPSGTEKKRPAPMFDEIAVQRAMRGSDVRLRPAERTDAVRRLTEMGLSSGEIADRLSVPKRSVTRYRAAIRQAMEVAS